MVTSKTNTARIHAIVGQHWVNEWRYDLGGCHGDIQDKHSQDTCYSGTELG